MARRRVSSRVSEDMISGLDKRYIEKLDRWSSHTIIHDWLGELPAETSVLDIGTAGGMLGKRFQNSGMTLKGIEVLPEYAEAARPYYSEVICARIEDVPDEFIAGQDVIVCADVLEHLVDPTGVLDRLVKLQKPKTQLMISVPNVANLWIRVNLLFGKFDYTENGILDRDHLHFYTRRTFKHLLFNSGLRILEVKYTTIPLNRLSAFFSENWLGRAIHKILAGLTQLTPTLLAYQFVVRTTIDEKG